MDVHGQRDRGFDRTVQRRELLVVIVGLAGDLSQEALQIEDSSGLTAEEILRLGT